MAYQLAYAGSSPNLVADPNPKLVENYSLGNGSAPTMDSLDNELTTVDLSYQDQLLASQLNYPTSPKYKFTVKDRTAVFLTPSIGSTQGLLLPRNNEEFFGRDLVPSVAEQGDTQFIQLMDGKWVEFGGNLEVLELQTSQPPTVNDSPYQCPQGQLYDAQADKCILDPASCPPPLVMSYQNGLPAGCVEPPPPSVGNGNGKEKEKADINSMTPMLFLLAGTALLFKGLLGD